MLAVLGVDLIAAFVLARRRWLKGQQGEFAGAVRISRGEADGLTAKWKCGSGRWVRDVFVWSKGSLRLRNVLVPVDPLSSERQAHAGEVKRLGNEPVITEFASEDAAIESPGEPSTSAGGGDHHHLIWTTNGGASPPPAIGRPETVVQQIDDVADGVAANDLLTWHVPTLGRPIHVNAA